MNKLSVFSLVNKLKNHLTSYALKRKKASDFNRFENQLYRTYYHPDQKKGTSNALIVMIDEHTPKGGLVDKLKGIISGYLLAQSLNYQFYVYIKSENFPLFDFLRENFPIYLMAKTEILSFNKEQCRPFVIYNHMPFSFQWILWRLRRTSQIHLYCNLDLTRLIKGCSKTDATSIWSKTFCKLFYFDNAIINAFPNIPSGVKKIGIHLRFMSLLGDFIDSGVEPHLTRDQQVILMNSCKKSLINILKREESNSIFFLFTDSVRFIDSVFLDAEIRDLKRNIVADKSNIAHTGLMNDVSSLERAIRDLFFLTKCEPVYLIKNLGMHNSDFSRYASVIGCGKFIVLD